MRRLLGDIHPRQRRRLALGAALLAALAVATALQPPFSSSANCRRDLAEDRHVVVDGAVVSRCVLHADGRKIVISRFGKAPRRGKVVSLQDAKRRYDSFCLEGPGREYVVVGKSGGREEIVSSNASERILGLAGTDVIDGRLGDDCIDGGEGADEIDGGGDADLLFGGPGADRIVGGGGKDQIDGGPGNDTLNGGQGADLIQGGAGNDAITGGGGKDLIDAGPGNDIVTATQPHLFGLDCGPGKDRATVDARIAARVRHCEVVQAVRG